ncbi:MAG TPA: tellurite resistance TerB family protein [Polyangiaceae bacterium]|jgi:tellurite resistance protein|nr:tellurite resistance TerB family protein [Polyangiaceae bacterium]
MTAGAGESLLGRVVSSIAGSSEPSSRQKSIFSQAAASFGRRPTGAESTIPTGFDPQAASLFEAVIEAAFLVANADGVFDDTERDTFERVVAEACRNSVRPGSLHALVSDLLEQFEEDGLERRVQMVASVVHSQEHKTEVLRIAALMAHISGGVHDSERRVMDKLAGAFGLGSDVVTQALTHARQALDG